MDWEARTVSLLLCLTVLLASIQHGNADRKIVCYYTNWSIYRPGTAKFSPQNINPYLCTHLIYAFGGFTKDNTLKPFDKYQDIEKGGYAKFTGLKTYNKNLKTMLAIGGWNEGSSRFSPMVADSKKRREFVKNSVKFLRKNHFDGLDLDWEYPAFRDGGKPRDKDNYASLVQELKEEFERESSKTGRPRLLLSLAMPAGIEYIDKGYDVPRLNEYLDFINLLSYDYHSSYEPAVNHHSPLYPLEEDNEYNYDSELTIDYTINYLMTKGASPEKIILGIPTYGRSYTLFNEDATDLGSPADGPGVEGDATREKGYLAYYEICESLGASDEWEIIQPNPKAMGPYAVKADQWVGYDDEDIVKLKAKYANEKKLGGIMFWTIDNDDFRGKCHDRPYPLIEAAKESLLADSTSSFQESKTPSGRKKIQEVQSNTIGRKFGSAGRRSTTTAAPVSRKRVTSPRPKFRTKLRSAASNEDEEDQEVDRRAYDSGSEEEEDSNGGNAVRTAETNDRPRHRVKSRTKSSSNSGRNRRKQTRRRGGNKSESEEESLSNKLTTPEPPTTPDPGTDFKCEDEGFFSHPRDCKKYFWCLDSGPGGLGVVAHQFTCPSGLVFNKAADSCDYPRNVVCPKSRTSQSAPSTTRAPITAATSRTTYLYSATRKSTTDEPSSEEEYEYYDDEDVSVEEEEKREKGKPRTTSTSKPLLYKTINRSRPTTTTTTSTTTTTTETPSTTGSKPDVLDIEDEEDPRVIKELIKLIKKAGGIEELEKQLLFQGKSPDDTDNEKPTPATISRTLYERVLSRQGNKISNRQRTSTNYANGPGGAQFEGLDEVPEVQSLRRSQKPQYVTIERPKPSRKETPVEDEEDEEPEDLDDDTADVASSEERKVSNPFLTSSTQRATPTYVNIRRARPTTTTTSRYENDVEEKEEEVEEEVPVRRRRPNVSPRSTEINDSSEEVKDEESRSSSSDESLPTTKSRYISIHRFRSTTPKLPDVSEEASPSQEPTTEPTVSTESAKVEEDVATTQTSFVPSSTPSSTAGSVVFEETEKSVGNTSVEVSSTTESVKLVEDSATEILLTTAPASLSTLSAPGTRITVATVSQPRPFSFNRRQRPATESSTTPLPSTSEQPRPKVASSEAIRLPTLKELIGYQTNVYPDGPSAVHLSLLPLNGKTGNSVLEENTARPGTLPGEQGSSVPHVHGANDDPEPWTEEKGYGTGGRGDDLDLIGGREAYYVEENVADDEDASPNNKRRFDREDSTTTTGTPLIDLVRSNIPRGFFITRTETEAPTTDRTESDVTTVESSTLPMEMDETVSTAEPANDSTSANSVVPVTEVSTASTLPKDNEGIVDTLLNRSDNSRDVATGSETSSVSALKYPEPSTSPSTDGRVMNKSRSGQKLTQKRKNARRTTVAPSTTPVTTVAPSTTPISTVAPSTTPITTVAPSTTPVTTVAPSTTPLTTETPLATVTASTIPVASNESSSASSDPTSVKSASREFSNDATTNAAFVTDTDHRPSTVALETSSSSSPTETASGPTDKSIASDISTIPTALPSTTELPPAAVAESTPAPAARNESAKSEVNRRRQRIRPTSSLQFGDRASGPVYPRRRVRPAIEEERNSRKEAPRRVAVYRRRQRRPVASVPRRETNDPAETENDLRVEESEDGRKLAPIAIGRKNDNGNGEEQLREPEVNSSENATRAPGSPASTRLRKPSSQASKPASPLVRHRNNRLNKGNSSLATDKPDTADQAPEAEKRERDIDQSSRAQEIAVTLADPPSPQSSSTGRPPFRNALRRKISTTVVPRIDATTSRTIVRYTPPVRDRQRPKTKDRPLQNATTRPRRPAVIDYDYYEDEEEPVVRKSTLNGKLYLTSKGTIRCLDQGNFPHPDSCRKFITCAKMVNGLVVGAEYTCPEKLSFDPVGGICNWSAGLGCKE